MNRVSSPALEGRGFRRVNAMKPSQFNHITPISDEKGKYLLYNTRSTAVLAIGEKEQKLLKAFEGQTPPPISDEESYEFIQTLIGGGV